MAWTLRYFHNLKGKGLKQYIGYQQYKLPPNDVTIFQNELRKRNLFKESTPHSIIAKVFFRMAECYLVAAADHRSSYFQ